MDFIVDVLVEIFFGVFAEGYVSLAARLMPNRTRSKRTQNMMSVIACLLGLLMFVLLVVGIIFLANSSGHSPLGWVFIGLCSIYAVLTITLKMISVAKK